MTILYLYATIFAIYFILYAISSSGYVRKLDKYTQRDANICVVVYASGNVNTLENLLLQLKNQNYPKHNYTIYAILDKCENISDVTLQSDLNINVVNINNLEPIGKSQAYSIIAEKLYEVENLDAYVFLDAKNYIDADFLKNANFYLTKYQVFNPTTVYLPVGNDFNFWEKVKVTYARYVHKFINISRNKMGLTNTLNTDAFVITKDLLNKMASFDFRNIISEVEYTLKLAEENIKVGLIDDLKIYKSVAHYDYRIPSLSKRLSIVWSALWKPHTVIAREYLTSHCAPNWLTFVLCFVLPLMHARNFPFAISLTTIWVTIILFLIAFNYGLFNMKFYPKEYLYLYSYPILSLGKLIYNFPLLRWVRGLFNKTAHKHVIEKMKTNVIVTDGSRDLNAQLELISDDGLAKVVFINPNGKKYVTKNNHLRMIDALRELSAKLNDYGLTLKVCQNCKYFQPLVDGSTNMVKGTCNCQFQGRTPGDILPTLIWNICSEFELHNVINLF